jgi:hypothetical protein
MYKICVYGFAAEDVWRFFTLQNSVWFEFYKESSKGHLINSTKNLK